MKRRTMVFIVSAAIIVALIVGSILIFTPRRIVNKSDDIDGLKVTYHNTLIPVNQNDIIDILSKYNAVATIRNVAPYKTAKVDFEIDLVANGKPVHIVLGEFNIWYESGEGYENDILDAGRLKEELKNVLDLK
ncbi:MAG: hypothetical protein ACM3S4_02930 [Burkholderiales bacterium]